MIDVDALEDNVNDDAISYGKLVITTTSTITKHSTIQTATTHLINLELRQQLITKYVTRFTNLTGLDSHTREALILEDTIGTAYQESFRCNLGGS